MKTRQQYMNGAVSHREYYAQFVNDDTKNLVLRTFGLSELQKAFEKDEHFNSLPLIEWDAKTDHLNVDKQLREVGDTPTLAGKVCILKEAAKQVVESA